MSVLDSHCRHEIGDEPMRHKCALGIDIRKHVGGSDLGWLRRHPCYFPNRDNPGFVPCDKAEPYTAEEIAEDERAMDAAVARLQRTLPLLEKIKTEYAGKNWSGVVVCPECGGQLRLSHAAINGHVWCKCATEGCLAWME